MNTRHTVGPWDADGAEIVAKPEGVLRAVARVPMPSDFPDIKYTAAQNFAITEASHGNTALIVVSPELFEACVKLVFGNDIKGAIATAKTAFKKYSEF